MNKKSEKICQICNSSYTTYNKISVACCREHLSEWRRRTYKGRKFTPEHIAKLNVSKLRENVVKHGDYPCDKCGKLFVTNTSLRSHRSYCSSIGEETLVKCNVCNKKFKRQRGLTWHMRSHDPEFFEMHSKRISKGLEKSKPRKRNSLAEIAFYSSLKEIYGNEVIHCYYVEGINHEYDFYVPSKNLIIEYDGDYWHGNAELYELTPKMKKQFRIDITYTRAAEKLGLSVHRVWGHQSMNYPNNLRIL